MRKIFSAMLIALIIFGVQNICAAAKISREHLNGNVKIIYPVVRLKNVSVAERINEKILEEIQTFVKETHYAAQYDNRKILDVRTNCRVGSNESGGTVILSLVITESFYPEGAAHPTTYEHALNFNTANGERMGLNCLTDIGEGISVEKLIERLDKKLREHCAREGIHLFDEALPLKNLPENFYWDKNLHVHFIFQHYEIAPYAAGIIDVDIDG